MHISMFRPLAAASILASALVGCAPGSVNGTVDGESISINSVRAALSEGEADSLVVVMSETAFSGDEVSAAALNDTWSASISVLGIEGAGTVEVGSLTSLPAIIAGFQRFNGVGCDGDEFTFDNIDSFVAEEGSVTVDVAPAVGESVSGSFEFTLDNGDEVNGTFSATVEDGEDAGDPPSCIE